MKRLYLLLLLMLVVAISYAQQYSIDSKYVKVGVISNEWPSCMSNNSNIRNLGMLSKKAFDPNRIGKKVLDILFQRDENGLHMDRLYSEALQNTTVEELEVAMKDVSAEKEDNLKRAVARQLLKNNYVIVFTEKQKTNWLTGEVVTKKYWTIYHVEIDDRIIEQAYSNWRNPDLYDQIVVPVKMVAQGKVHKNAFDENEFIYDIAKKVPAFAVRGPVTSRFPLVARMGDDMGVKRNSRIFVYRFKENKKGNFYSKKVSTTRATDVSADKTRMFMISGISPSTKKGDVAVLKDRHRSSVSLLGQGSFGNDARIGGRLQYEYLLDFSKRGVAQYFLCTLGYNRHDKEPNGIWWNETKNIQPALNNINVSFGYGVGINFLGRMEFMPYILAGYQCSLLTGSIEPPYYWNSEQEVWTHLDEIMGHGFVGHGGATLNINLWYPLQVSMGVDYNISTKSPVLAPVLNNHKINRVNLYAGLRFHF
jgi:hypothetical protein